MLSCRGDQLKKSTETLAYLPLYVFMEWCLSIGEALPFGLFCTDCLQGVLCEILKILIKEMQLTLCKYAVIMYDT
jgi:hypothetical protein